MKTRNLWLLVFALGVFQLSAQERGRFVENADPRLDQLMEAYKRDNANRPMQGFRIQLYNGQRSTVNEYRTRFIRKFPEMDSRVIFESPDYKLQIGNYRSIYEAEQALNLIRQEFPGALIVETRIEPPKMEKQD